MGESMGGAMALRLHRKKPDYWDGAVLVAPMCKVVRKRTLLFCNRESCELVLDTRHKFNINYICLELYIYVTCVIDCSLLEDSFIE